MIGANQTATFGTGTSTLAQVTSGGYVYSANVIAGSADATASFFDNGALMFAISAPAKQSFQRLFVSGVAVTSGKLVVQCSGGSVSGDVEV